MPPRYHAVASIALWRPIIFSYDGVASPSPAHLGGAQSTWRTLTHSSAPTGRRAQHQVGSWDEWCGCGCFHSSSSKIATPTLRTRHPVSSEPSIPNLLSSAPYRIPHGVPHQRPHRPTIAVTRVSNDLPTLTSYLPPRVYPRMSRAGAEPESEGAEVSRIPTSLFTIIHTHAMHTQTLLTSVPGVNIKSMHSVDHPDPTPPGKRPNSETPSVKRGSGGSGPGSAWLWRKARG
ncbi:uncharacterized protein B0H64DRAFT_228807 [Chaetomium fimeti]|uniref:Uncharacterized protein n=1 Tax=Chaetomium fimeti TaxID=1854472 RepID=A0AAE0HA11_9PEZI|nr:hypothetical protein B0H64DRAFT_228807 [Chaetomium fimeti]